MMTKRPMLTPEQRKTKVQLRPCVEEFAMSMEKTLRRNDWKGGWNYMSGDELFSRLSEEVEELRLALVHHRSRRTIVREAADVANFAMMIADQCG